MLFFLEQCFNLLKDGGSCGIIVPTGVYTDLGTKQLREMLFFQCSVDALYSFSNERFIFEGVDHRFKFCLLTFDKGGKTDSFTAAFRIDPREAISKERIGYFLTSEEEHIEISVPLIRKLSPGSGSVMEFRKNLDIQIAEKMVLFPSLGEKLNNKWNFSLFQEMNITSDSHLFHKEFKQGRLPLFTGKMFHQFELTAEKPIYWIDEKEGRQSLLGKAEDNNQLIDYQGYRWVHRRIARSTDSRTFICSITPKNVFYRSQ